MSYDPRDYPATYEQQESEEREERERALLEEQELLEMQDAIDPDLAEVFGSSHIAQPVAEALAAWRKSVSAVQGGKAVA